MVLPTPVPGMVISYSYLWRHEYHQGREEGTKNRPCAIVFQIETSQEAVQVMVAPITHRPPTDARLALEIPVGVKRHLGLDNEKSWVILDDYNIFDWPGHDLQPIAGRRKEYHYGYLPPKFLQELQNRARTLGREKRIWVGSRD